MRSADGRHGVLLDGLSLGHVLTDAGHGDAFAWRANLQRAHQENAAIDKTAAPMTIGHGTRRRRLAYRPFGFALVGCLRCLLTGLLCYYG